MKQDLILNLYRIMKRIRLVEEEIALQYPKWEMRCPTHLSIGQEAVAAALSMCIRKDDFAVSTHRGHAHYLAKGGSLKSMIAEIYGKSTGCSRGKGGSMHLIDKDVGFMGTSAIVGNSIPIGVGLALSAHLNFTDQISCVFLGDGATEEGVFYESVNFAVLKNLPVIFICENNLYSVYSPLEVRQPKGRKISKMVESIGATSLSGDGNDVTNCYRIFRNSVNSVRSGLGPYFIEFFTYRYKEHCGHEYDNNLGYRSVAEFETWKKRDPIELCKKQLLETDLSLIRKLDKIDQIIKEEISDAFLFAQNSPFPEPQEAFSGLYADS